MERMQPRLRQHISNNATGWVQSEKCPAWVACFKKIKASETELNEAAGGELSNEDQQMLYMVGLCYDDFADQWKMEGLSMDECIYAIYNLILTSRDYRQAAEARLRKWHQATQQASG